MSFYVEITNLSEEPQLVDPSKFYYLSQFAAAEEVEVDSLVYSINPEEEIDKIDKKITQEQNSHEVTTAVNSACLFSGCLFSAGNVLSGDLDEAAENQENIDETLEDMEREKLDHTVKMHRLEGERAYWANEALRKTTLTTNQKIGGLVTYPITKESDEINLYFPIQQAIFRFDYKQVWEKM